MRTFTKEGRQLEKQLNQSGYEEPLLDTEELYNYENEENQGHSHREYNTNGDGNYSVGGHLLIKPQLSPFVPEILNYPMPLIQITMLQHVKVTCFYKLRCDRLKSYHLIKSNPKVL